MDVVDRLVSIIIPTYNHAEYLSEAIGSALNQTYQNIEVIVIDNFSVDNTEEVVRSFDNSKLKYFKFNNEGVIAKARNFGVSKSTGYYVAFLDSDDVWRENKIEVQLMYFDKAVAAVSSQYTPIGEKVFCYNHLKRKLMHCVYKDFTTIDILVQNPVVTSSLIMKKMDFLKSNGFNEGDCYRYIEDWELWIRLSEIGKIRVLANALISYRIFSSKERDKTSIAKNCLNLLFIYKNKIISKKGDYFFLKAVGDFKLGVALSYLNSGRKAPIGCFFYAFFLSTSFFNKARSIVGLVLCVVSLKTRRNLIEKLYFFRSYFQRS